MVDESLRRSRTWNFSDPLEAACAAFNAVAGECSLPEGCSLRLEAERLEGGRMGVKIMASDEKEIVWRKEEAELASAVYRPMNEAPLELPAVLNAFAEKLEGKAGKPVDLPNGLRAICASAVESAAKAAEACRVAPLPEEENAETWTASPR